MDLKRLQLAKECVGIINQLYDLAEVPLEKRKAINDEADKYLLDQVLRLCVVSITEGKLPLWTNDDVDAAYLMGCINVGGMDALQDELNKIKELGLKPHQVVKKVRGKSGN